MCLPGRASRLASGPSGVSSRGLASRAKKTTHASEQDRPDILRRRRNWFEGQLDLEAGRLVFIDDTWASVNMAHRHGRCARGGFRVGFT